MQSDILTHGQRTIQDKPHFCILQTAVTDFLNAVQAIFQRIAMNEQAARCMEQIAILLQIYAQRLDQQRFILLVVNLQRQQDTMGKRQYMF